ncbi:hypothetical protein M8J75_012112 [Diaphorina citri]|nr:hypothetical protein M8J75_012112 [Diaphorina citri]
MSSAAFRFKVLLILFLSRILSGSGSWLWYFASDADIRESSLAQALKSVAYMLFYERCSPTLIDVQSETTSGDSMPDVAPTSTRLTNGHCVT